MLLFTFLLIAQQGKNVLEGLQMVKGPLECSQAFDTRWVAFL